MKQPEASISSNKFSVWEADHECWKCLKTTKVYAISINDQLLKNISSLSDEAVQALTPISKTFFRDKSGMAESTYYMNHCEHCGTKQGDWFLHMEPDGVFWGEHERRLSSSHQIPIDAEISF